MASRRNSSNRLREAPATQVPRERRALSARLQAWLEHHRGSFRSSLRRLRDRAWSSILTVLVMGIALALPFLLHVLLDNARSLSGGLQEAREITVFLKSDEDDASARTYASELEARSDVTSVTVRTPAEGLAEFRQLSGFAEALDVLDGNPLPGMLVIKPRDQALAADPALLADLKADPRVDMVQYDAAWRQRLSAILRFGERSMLALMGLLGLASLLVVGNTIRMDIQARAEEIAVVQLMGASDGFVRRPFLYAGFWYGLIGGLLAVLAVGIVELSVRAPLFDLLASYQNRFALHGFNLLEALAVVAISSLLGWLGAWIVTTRYLLTGRPKT